MLELMGTWTFTVIVIISLGLQINMGKEDDLEEILLNDASNIAFEREKYEKETYEINLGIKGLSARALTSFDRQKLEMLEDLAKKKQLLNAREERYFDSLNEFRSNLRLSDMKEQELVKRNSSSIPAPKKTSTIYYLVEERDAILLEKKRIRSELNRLLENEEIGPQAGRSNLLRNSEGPKLHLGKQVTGPCRKLLISRCRDLRVQTEEDQRAFRGRA
jgi:hypothetical protein